MAWFLAVFVLCGAAWGGPSSDPPNVILSSWDGLDRFVLWELLAKQRLPNLAAIIREGSLQEIEVRGHKTETKPSHAEMLTGLGVQDTGVVSNLVYRAIPEGYSIFERLQNQLGGNERIATIMVTGKIANVGGRGPEEVRRWQAEGKDRHVVKKYGKSLPDGADNAPEKEGKFPEEVPEPFYLTRKSLDVFDGDQRDASETGPLFLRYLEKHKSRRFLAFLHFSDPDHAGHLFSSDSQEYRHAAVECDRWLGDVVAWLRKEGLYDQTLIYVTTDHGFDAHARRHGHAPHAWLATNDPQVTHGGIIADIPATILTRLGVDLDGLKPSLIGKPLTGPFERKALPAPLDWPVVQEVRDSKRDSWFTSMCRRVSRYFRQQKPAEKG